MFFRHRLTRKLLNASTPRPEFQAALRSQLVGASAKPRYVPPFAYAGGMLAVVLAGVFGLGGYAYASPAVSEGTVLYPVKEQVESWQEKLRHSSEAQAAFRARLMRRRLAEASYRLRHDQPLPPAMLERVASELELSPAELRAARTDAALRNELRARLQGRVTASLQTFHERIAASDLETTRKTEILDRLDARLQLLD